MLPRWRPSFSISAPAIDPLWDQSRPAAAMCAPELPRPLHYDGSRPVPTRVPAVEYRFVAFDNGIELRVDVREIGMPKARLGGCSANPRD